MKKLMTFALALCLCAGTVSCKKAESGETENSSLSDSSIFDSTSFDSTSYDDIDGFTYAKWPADKNNNGDKVYINGTVTEYGEPELKVKSEDRNWLITFDEQLNLGKMSDIFSDNEITIFGTYKGQTDTQDMPSISLNKIKYNGMPYNMSYFKKDTTTLATKEPDNTGSEKDLKFIDKTLLDDGTTIELYSGEDGELIHNIKYKNNSAHDNIYTMLSLLTTVFEHPEEYGNNVLFVGYYEGTILYTYTICKQEDGTFAPSVLGFTWFDKTYEEAYYKIKYEHDDSKNDNSSSASSVKEYNVGETWVVDGQWAITIDYVEETFDRNSYSDKKPAAVYIINYTYENLGYEGYIADGLYITLDEGIVDSQGYMGYSYPGDITYRAKEVPIGAKCQAQSCVGVDHAGNFKINVSKYDGNNNKQKAVFSIEFVN